jgi:UDP-GlcNAc3NAcA epimerase
VVKITTVVGARPQFVKAAVLSRHFKGLEAVSETIVHTGQHFDDSMSKIFFDELDIPHPAVNLGIHSVDHCAMIGRLIEKLGDVYTKNRPNLVLVYGDTNSTLAAAIAAKKHSIPLVHVEAGIRTGDEHAPEESNRYLVDRMSAMNFCCTQTGLDNLVKEGFQSGLINSKIFNYGDVMKDAVLHYTDKRKVAGYRGREGGRPSIAVTIHRAENTDSSRKLREIVDGLNFLSKDFEIIFPIHPRTMEAVKRLGAAFDFPVLPPVGYIEMLDILSGCHGVLTDSGGLVREAYFFGRPSVYVLDRPAWVELIENGSCERADCSAQSIFAAARRMVGRDVSTENCPFGRGDAGSLIAKEILASFS